MVAGARIVRVCLGAFAVCIAALLAHAAIDALGDLFLAHDAYDDVAHQSRAMAALAALLLLAAGGLRFAGAALRAIAGEGADLTVLLRRSIPRNRALFAGIVIVFALPLLAGMEAFDVLSAGGTIDDLGDLLAGAPFFSISVLAVVAAAVALAVHWAFALLLSSTNAILAMLTAFLGAAELRRPAFAFSVEAAPRRPAARGVLARHGGLRAPPFA